MSNPELTQLKRRRGIARASITRVENRIKELEGLSEQPSTTDYAQQLATKLETLDSDFKSYHFQIVDKLDNDELLEKEQETLDNHDDLIADMNIRLKRLSSIATPTTAAGECRILSRRLDHLARSIASSQTSIQGLTDEDSEELDSSLLEQFQAQLSDFKATLTIIHTELISIDNQDKVEDQLEQHAELEATLFECSRVIRKLLKTGSSSRATVTSDLVGPGSGVKLPKIDVPTFNGDILQWRQFWEQFCVSVHNRSNLTNAEKMVYLQHALKDGSAKSIIEGLAQSGEQYSEAVECLASRFDRPRLIYQTHVKMILEAPQLRDGNGKELRRLHDTVQQHVRALKSIGEEPSPSFVTSIIELKLDTTTMFEWHRHTQEQNETPHYKEILEFLDRRAQASEISTPLKKQSKSTDQHFRKPFTVSKLVSSYAVNLDSPNFQCPLCRSEKHPLYSCPRFKSLPHDKKLSTVKVNNLCMNCLGKGHFVAECKSLHKCRKCQNPHHTLLHSEVYQRDKHADQTSSLSLPTQDKVSANLSVELKHSTLLMTCRIRIMSPDGSSLEARALLDSGSSASFVSERLVQLLQLKCNKQRLSISGIGDLSSKSLVQSITRFRVLPFTLSHKKSIDVTALVVPRVTCDLPTSAVPFNPEWSHIANLPLADPEFGVPGRVDVLLGIDVFMNVLLNGRRKGPRGSPIAIETLLGWVLCGNVSSIKNPPTVMACHASYETGDDLLRKFWELEESPNLNSDLTMDEHAVVNHFKTQHTRNSDGRYVVPLPKKSKGQILGESRSQAVRRFLILERSLNNKNHFKELDEVIMEYFTMDHAEVVPSKDLEKPVNSVFYLPIHAVYKKSSSTTKVRAVFDASAKSATGVSLNDLLLVGPTIHPTLIDVILRFRLHRIALAADVSKMYRNVELAEEDKDLHRFVWRSRSTEPLKDYRMKRVTFGVSASSFAANMSVRQNAIDQSASYPLAAKVVKNSIYVDDCLTGADNLEDAILLYQQLLNLFQCGGFLLRKWKTSDSVVLHKIDPSLRDTADSVALTGSEEYTKALGLEWNTSHDHFRLTMSEMSSFANITKRALISNIAKIYDVLGWFAPVVIKMKILLQRLWELKIDWDDHVPSTVNDVWSQWKSELHLLSGCHIPRYHFPKDVNIVAIQLHGFCDASEDAYAGVVYMRGEDTEGKAHVSLVMAKTKVSPIKRLTIPRLELCGAHLLSELLHHVKGIYQVSTSNIYAWTDSTIVLNWLDGSPRRFKTYVGNRVSLIISRIPPNCWNHVHGFENPADCASRGIFPSELVHHQLWWQGPDWLKSKSTDWPVQSILPPSTCCKEEERELCLVSTYEPAEPVLALTNYSTFARLQRITAWVFRFVNNCRKSKVNYPYLLPSELSSAEKYWISISQHDCFHQEIVALKSNCTLPNSSALNPFNPFIDQDGLVRVGGRLSNSRLPYNRIHPILLHGKHPVTKLLIKFEHIRLLHAGATLVMSSVGLRFRVISLKKIVRSTVRDCIICKRQLSKASHQLQGQLPPERVTPGSVFERVGVDYAGPVTIKYGYVRKPVFVKAYICLFVSLTVKAVHLEIVSDLTTEAFIAALRRFIARRGYPTLLWSDNGTNFIGANRHLKELFQFVKNQDNKKAIVEFCASKNIEWRFIPERSPHFGGLWEAAVKSMKFHLRRIVSDVKLTFEEMNTVICQIEACLNSRPLVSMNEAKEDSIEVLTPGHFLIGQPLVALPDQTGSEPSTSVLRRWHLCQNLTRHFWNKWSVEYVTELNKYTKWYHKSRNVEVGDIVLLRDETLFPTKWPLARVVAVHPGKDSFVRVVTIKTEKGTYKRPITKIVVLLPTECDA